MDAVVIGAGPNGLVAANLLADAGWDVVVFEAEPEPGGAVRSARLAGGFVQDRFSAFYPLAAASPVLRSLGLEGYGLRWRRAPLALAHPAGEGERVVLSQDIDETAASLDADHPGDGDAWRSLQAAWRRSGPAVVDALLGPFPPVRPAASLAWSLRAGLADFARFALLPVRRMAAEQFGGRGAAMLLAGNALHADLSPDAPLSGFFGWLLACLGQEHGFPVPAGGAGNLTGALVRRLEARGGQVVCDAPVERVVVERGRAVGVRVAGGRDVRARRAVLADVGAPALYRDLVGFEHLPDGLAGRLDRFQYDHGTVKVDWALDAPVPWRSAHARRAGTLHLADGIDHLAETALHLGRGEVPSRPFLVLGQMTTADPSRSPAGTETAWAYTHVPQPGAGSARWDARACEAFAARLEECVEEHAPGFRRLVRARAVAGPRELEAADANLVGGAVNGGTAQIHQQLVFRPTPGLGRPSTPVRGLFLASASAHPGGGVHGACGAHAAAAALAAERRRRFLAAAGAAGAAAVAARRLRRRALG